MAAKKENDAGEWLDLYDNALADSRVAGGIAHGCSLALFGKEEIRQEELGDALEYVREACARITASLLKMDQLRMEVDLRTADNLK